MHTVDFMDRAAFALLILQMLIMAYAAVHDARTRTVSNGLVVVLALACAIGTCLSRAALGAHVACALGAMGTLTVFECAWRHVKGEAGLGMGDVKFLGAIMLRTPLLGIVSFACGLAGVALVGTVLRARSLPLLPFMVVSFIALAALSTCS